MENPEEVIKKQRLSKKDIDEFNIEQYEKCRELLTKLESLGENSKYDNQKSSAIKAYFVCVDRMQKIMQQAVESDKRIQAMEDGEDEDEDENENEEVRVEFGT